MNRSSVMHVALLPSTLVLSLSRVYSLRACSPLFAVRQRSTTVSAEILFPLTTLGTRDWPALWH